MCRMSSFQHIFLKIFAVLKWIAQTAVSFFENSPSTSIKLMCQAKPGSGRVAECLQRMQVSELEYQQECAKFHRKYGKLELFGREQFKRVKEVYLDHAGATLPADILLQNVFKDYTSQIVINPHSSQDGSDEVSYISQARKLTLEFLNTDSNHYTCIFTSGATDALRLLAQSFNWNYQNKKGNFSHTFINHNSVLGIRQVAVQQGADYVPLSQEVLSPPKLKHNQIGLFALPHQCNFSGEFLPVEEVVNLARENGWYVVVDAAKSCQSCPLNLQICKADFVVLSYYKIFGYPTGLGALIVRNSAMQILNQPGKYYGGGTVQVSLPHQNFHQLRKPPEGFENGTLNFYGIKAVIHGFNFVQQQLGGLQTVKLHIGNLSEWLHSNLKNLRHSNTKNQQVCEIYGEDVRSGIVCFNLLTADGEYIGYSQVQRIMSLYDIVVRTGCMCNPGACSKYLKLSSEKMQENYQQGHICWDNKDIIDGQPTGAVRLSFGYSSTFEDAFAIFHIIQKLFVHKEQIRNNSLQNQSQIQEQISFPKQIFVKQLFVYPIKSCGAFEVKKSWPVGHNGLLYDREWLLVDQDGNGITQKNYPEIIKIKPRIDLYQNQLIVEHLNTKQSLAIDISQYVNQNGNVRKRKVLVCGQSMCGIEQVMSSQSLEADKWFSKVLGIECKLVRHVSEQIQHKNGSYQKLNFANDQQFLVVNQKSINKLNNKMAYSNELIQNVPNVHFRPNIVVDGDDLVAFEEDNWKQIEFENGLQLQVVKLCNRCDVLCNDQINGSRIGASVLRTLASFQRQKGGQIFFGILCQQNKGDDRRLELCIDIDERVTVQMMEEREG